MSKISGTQQIPLWLVKLNDTISDTTTIYYTTAYDSQSQLLRAALFTIVCPHSDPFIKICWVLCGKPDRVCML